MKKWYVVHTQTGSEDKVKSALDRAIALKKFSEFISQVIIPAGQFSEIRSGKKKVSQKKFFPGYILIEMELNDDTYSFVKATPGVTGFIGSGRQPAFLSEDEVNNIFKKAHESESKPAPKVSYEKGESIRITDGPFENFNGTVEEIKPDKGKLKVSVSIFGRSTPVELEYWQVEKL